MFKKTAFLIVSSLMLVACGPEGTTETESTDAATDVSASASEDGFTTDDDRVLYTMGLMLGDQISGFNLTAEEMVYLAEGLTDAATNAEPKLEIEMYGPLIQAFLSEKAAEVMEQEKAASAAFAEEIAAEEGAEVLDSGVVVVTMEEGDGEYPTAESTVLVHYHGTLRDGSVFDSSVERGDPIEFPLSGVIPCWTEGVQKIRVGGMAKLLCPSDTAYGDNGTGAIPGGAALLFEVELLGIDPQ